MTNNHTVRPEQFANPAEYWDALYSQSERIWSGNANVILVREATGLTPGRALDLGSGEGADAVWLAERGWRVTAVDISRVALDRGAARAAEAGVAGRIDWQRHDLAYSFPTGSYELVTASFLHSETPMPREQMLRAAAAAVAPGGVLLVVGHAHGGPADHNHHHIHLPTPAEVLTSLDLPTDEWEVLLAEEHERSQVGPDGVEITRMDNVVKARRH